MPQICPFCFTTGQTWGTQTLLDGGYLWSNDHGMGATAQGLLLLNAVTERVLPTLRQPDR